MRRRTFIGLLAVGTTGAVAGGYIYITGFDALARKIIVKDTASLKIAPGSIDQFLMDTSKYKKWEKLFSPLHQQLIKWHYYADNPLFTFPYASNYKMYRSRIVETFLLSTDFFIHKMDVNRQVNYRALYDPYLSPCCNPFSNLFYPDA